MFKTMLIASGVILAVALVVFFIERPAPPPADALLDRLSRLAELAERTCLSNVADDRTAKVKVTLERVKGVQGAAGVEARREAARGAATGLPAEVQAIENEQIRTCMQPWAQQLRDLANAPPAR